MELIDLKTSIRKEVGKGYARELRRKGMIPAVFYGPKIESILLSVNIKELQNTYKGKGVERVVYNLQIENGSSENKNAMIKELQRNPLTGQLYHADFYEIDMNQKIKTMVPVKTVGKSIGVEIGGIVQIVRRTLEVECLPMDIPDYIEIDISELDMGNSIHIEDVSVDEKLILPHDVNFTIITVVQPKGLVDEVSEDEEAEEGESADGGEDKEKKAEEKPDKKSDKKSEK